MVRVEGDAKIKIREAETQAEAIRKTADAKAYEAAKANEQPETYLRLRQLEADIARWKQWDGRYPQSIVQMGSSSATPIVMLPPLPMSPDAVKTAGTK